MRFVLVYRGQLSATQGKRGKTCHERRLIREQISPQIKRLWEVNESLVKLQWDARVPDGSKAGSLMGGVGTPRAPYLVKPPADPVGEGYEDLVAPIARCGKLFRPLIRKSLDLTCTLKILFLRQEDPGSLIKKAGDIDNRIKTFIDALEMPAYELDGDETDDLNFCLLEDDTLVRGLEISTERLLLPELDFPNQVHLVVEVVVHVEKVGGWNLCLL